MDEYLSIHSKSNIIPSLPLLLFFLDSPDIAKPCRIYFHSQLLDYYRILNKPENVVISILPLQLFHLHDWLHLPENNLDHFLLLAFPQFIILTL